ncbi:MAG: hypothetical protein ACXABY_03545 [Candidatus Thorarchaeota archaeon]|jgi:hypothetical protein
MELGIIALLGLLSMLLGGKILRDKPAQKPWAEENLPKSTQQITFERLYQKLYALYPGAQLFLSDKSYFLCAQDDIEAFLLQDKTNKFPYVANNYDCDDFSYRLMGQFSVPKWSGLCFGIVWTNTHALNCFFDESGEFWFLEPQTDKPTKVLKPWQGSKIRLIVM